MHISLFWGAYQSLKAGAGRAMVSGPLVGEWASAGGGAEVGRGIVEGGGGRKGEGRGAVGSFEKWLPTYLYVCTRYHIVRSMRVPLVIALGGRIESFCRLRGNCM